MAPFYVDNTMLSAFAKCTTKAVVRHGYHLTTKTERAEWLAGKAFHRAVAELYRGATREQAVAVFDEVYADWASQNISEPSDRLTHRNLQVLVNQWLFCNPVEKLPFAVVPELVEVPFEAPLDDNGDVVFVGRIDCLAHKGASYIVVEHKTTGKVSDYWAAQWRSDSQGSGYVWGAREGLVNGQALGLPVFDFMVNAVEFSRIPDGGEHDRKCKKHGVKYSECGPMHPVENSRLMGPFPRDEGMLLEWRADALSLALKLKAIIEAAPDLSQVGALAQEGRFSKECRFCEFEDSCLTGRKPEVMGATLLYAPWEPWKEVQEYERHAPR